jgi:DNA polymerase-3 subunit epsilon
MELALKKPIVFFDLETTGTNIVKDRVVEICILRVSINGEEKVKTWRVNPQVVIPDEVIDIHGISNEMVKDSPTFPEIAPEIVNFIKDADLAGYNSNKFDVPLLAEEMARADIEIDWEGKKMVDVQSIFFKKEPRNLSAAYRFYCNKELIGAHGAEADTRATYEILKAQIDHYDDLKNDIDFLYRYTKGHRKNADFAGMLVFNKDKEVCFNFGKYKHQLVKDVLKKDKGYYGWIQKSDFPIHTKKLITRIYLTSM